MPSTNLVPVNGVIQSISAFDNNCCMLEVTIRNSDGITNFIVSPDTYVIRNPRENIYAGEFDDNLESLDGTLKLNIGRSTEIVTSNGQPYDCSLAAQTLIVYYGVTTRSIPAQTTPRKIIVIC